MKFCDGFRVANYENPMVQKGTKKGDERIFWEQLVAPK